MNQRVAKVESLIQQVVATKIVELLEAEAAQVTVTRVDAAPDLRNATVWLGILGTSEQHKAILAKLATVQGAVQEALGAHMQTKFVPRLHFKLDSGGEYAAHIEQLLNSL